MKEKVSVSAPGQQANHTGVSRHLSQGKRTLYLRRHNMGFTKLHDCILNSSIWNEPDCVRIVWITLLAMSDENGEVKASLGGLAHQARKTVEDTTRALTVLLLPDADSSRPQFDGRRIEKIDGGWRLLNHAYYRELGMTDSQRAYWRDRQREHRKKNVNDSQRQTLTPASASVSASEGTGDPGGMQRGAANCTHPSDVDDLPPLTDAQKQEREDICRLAVERFKLAPYDSCYQRMRGLVTECLMRGHSAETLKELTMWATSSNSLDGTPQSVITLFTAEKVHQWIRTMGNHKKKLEREYKQRNR